MVENTNYTFEDCIKKCESIIDGIYKDGCQSIHLYSLKTFIYGMVDIYNKATTELQDEVNQFRAIGTIEEFKALKEKSVPTVTGEWIDTQLEYNNSYYKNAHVCSNCNDYYTTEYDEMKFCPNCGAKMTET